MIRLGTFVWLAILTLIGVGLYQVELGVLAKEAELKDINRKIDTDREAMHVLEAEWSYLNDPTRLAELTRRYTDLAPVTPTQIAGFDRLALRISEFNPYLPPFERNWHRDVPSNAASTPPPLASAQPAPPRVAATTAAATTAAATPAAAKAQPAVQTKKSLQPTDDQAAADDVINAILADMKKAQKP
ncbi:MAG TPA: hypothetical protein VMT54_11925 [Candidatus Cybelea sp.]|nr:hypothetical protein [Candidatus Cybelea sp.]